MTAESESNVYDIALEQQRKVREYQINATREIDKNLMNIAKFSAIVTGVLLTALSLLAEQTSATLSELNIILILGSSFGIVSIIFSTIFSIIGYSSIKLIYGVSVKPNLISEGSEFVLDLMYSKGMEMNRTNEKRIYKKTKWLDRSLALLATGIILSSFSVLSILFRVTNMISLAVLSIAIVLSIVVCFVIVYQGPDWNYSEDIKMSLD